MGTLAPGMRVAREPFAGMGVAHLQPARLLLVLCHGVNANASQLAPLAAALRAAVPGAAIFVPDAPERSGRRFWRKGRQWFSLRQPPEAQIEAARAAAAALNARVDAELVRLELPLNAVVFAGFSQGAMVALRAGLARLAAPRGIVALAGSLLAPPGDFVPACRPPVLLIHGTADRVVPVARSEEAEQRLVAAGVPVRTAFLGGRDHAIVEDSAGLAASFVLDLLLDAAA